MASISKFEALGVVGSVALMAGALMVVRGDIDNGSKTVTPSEQPAAVVVVNEEEENQTLALAQALLNAASNKGVDKLVVDDVKVGDGDEVEKGDIVSVHYIGQLQGGQQFDSSYDRGTPFQFTVGNGRVIQGWDEGLLGMKVGGQRILIIPSDLAYGDNGAGPIPGGATLVFAIELLEIK